MKIQVLSYQNKMLDKFPEYKITYSDFNTPQAFDDFDINIISLQDNDLWYAYTVDTVYVKATNDLNSIKQIIKTSHSSKTIICFPQNLQLYKDGRKTEIKNAIRNVRDAICTCLIGCKENAFNLIYENTNTTIFNNSYPAAFWFESNTGVLTSSNNSNKTTSYIFSDNLIFTSLDFEYKNFILKDFLIFIGLDENKIDAPDWIKGLDYFDDIFQKQKIAENNELIKRLRTENETANQKLLENQKYKSILCENGDRLVSVVFEILEKLLDCNLTGFTDEKKEDFLVKKNGVTFIGEIKGVTSNIKSEHVSQLDVHYQSYTEDLEENGITEDVKAILILNPLRNKPISEREEVHDKQIELAKRNKSLIITTETLLKLFELFLDQKVTSDKIVSILHDEIGLLKIESFLNSEEKVDISAYKI